MKRNDAKIVKFNSKPKTNIVEGNLALKNNNSFNEVQEEKFEYEKPKVLILKPKKNNKIFCGCWQVANQEDAC